LHDGLYEGFHLTAGFVRVSRHEDASRLLFLKQVVEIGDPTDLFDLDELIFDLFYGKSRAEQFKAVKLKVVAIDVVFG
jgi:hypothetical protein